MSYQSITVYQEEYVGVITLNHPEHMNTFSSELARELNQALLNMDMEGSIRVAVVKGAGKAFSAGIDMAEFPGKTLLEYRRWIGEMERMSMVIAEMRKPVIASVHGFAVANGAGLLAACDLAIVAEGTKIGASAINVGLFCMGPAVPISRSIGRKRCMEMLLTGDLIDAKEAEAWGLVNKVVPGDELEQSTMALARKLAEKSPLAIQLGKKAFYGMADLEFGKALELSNEAFAALCMTEDAKEGVDAFMNKRPPVWKER